MLPHSYTEDYFFDVIFVRFRFCYRNHCVTHNYL